MRVCPKPGGFGDEKRLIAGNRNESPRSCGAAPGHSVADRPGRAAWHGSGPDGGGSPGDAASAHAARAGNAAPCPARAAKAPGGAAPSRTARGRDRVAAARGSPPASALRRDDDRAYRNIVKVPSLREAATHRCPCPPRPSAGQDDPAVRTCLRLACEGRGCVARPPSPPTGGGRRAHPPRPPAQGINPSIPQFLNRHVAEPAAKGRLAVDRAASDSAELSGAMSGPPLKPPAAPATAGHPAAPARSGWRGRWHRRSPPRPRRGSPAPRPGPGARRASCARTAGRRRPSACR